MKIAVIAANGRSGREFVATALNAGHTIRAGVRGAHSLNENPNLETVICDGTNPQDVLNLIEGCDAVASFIGHGRKSPAEVQTASIKNVIDACAQLGIQRVISLTGTGVRFPDDKITLIDRFMNFSISIVDRTRVQDGINHVEVLKKSNLDWTVIRVLKLTNASLHKFHLTQNGPTRIFTSRKTVAHASLEVLEQNSFIRLAPIVGT